MKKTCENSGKCQLLLDQRTTVSKMETVIPEIQAVANALLEAVKRDNVALGESGKELSSIGTTLSGDVQSLAETVQKVAQIVMSQRERNDAMTATVSEMVEQLKQENEKLQTDKLTGLYNRHKFEPLFAGLEKEYREKGKVFSCAIIDIDHFKKINDNFSHIVGDGTLRHLSTVLLKYFGKAQVFRFGGEEFFIMVQCDAMKLSSALQNVLDYLNRVKLMYKEKTHIPLTFSGGVAEFKQSDNVDTIYERADVTMLEAKRAGRNRIHVGNVNPE